MSWPLVKIGNHIDILSGFAFKSSLFSDSGMPLIRIRDVLAGKTDTFYAGGYSEEYVIKKGDLLVGMDGDFNRETWNSEDALLNQRVCKLTADGQNLDQRFLYHLLPKELLKIHRNTPAVTVKHLSVKKIRDIEIPLPPLDEQKRIAAILDKADSVRRKRQQAIDLADDFLRSVFLDMFGEHFTTEGYAISNKKKIKELVDYIDYRGKTPEKSDAGIPLITAKNVKKGFMCEEPREFIPEKNYLDWMTRGLPREGDVLFTTEAPLGNAALLGCYEKVVVGQRLIALRAKGELTQEYLLYCLLNEFIQDEIYKRSSGSTVKGIRTKELYEIELPIPDIRLQEKFSKVYKKSVHSKHRLQEATIESDNMFNSLSQKAFAGELQE